ARTDRHVARLSCPARMHRDVPHLPTKRVTSYLWVNLSLPQAGCTYTPTTILQNRGKTLRQREYGAIILQ
ncbi:hypothetical protein, partial [Paraburkholderia aspalathi]|uniref:hypothetical protein n=1 Tax=Paraburkholderia aspalathi TaxID=1324617 RepID=UPI001F1BF0C3